MEEDFRAFTLSSPQWVLCSIHACGSERGPMRAFTLAFAVRTERNILELQRKEKEREGEEGW